MRHSMAWPRISSLDGRTSLSLSPDAIRKLGFDQIDAGDGFGDGVLDLDARVHLDEVKLAGCVHQEFDGAGILVADVGEAAAEGAAEFVAQLGRDLERGSFFNQLLVAALDGALAFKERGHVAVLVGQHLKFDVAGILNELFHVELAVAEGVGGFGAGCMEEIGKVVGSAHDAHAASAAAGLGLEDYGEADLLCPVLRFFNGGNDAVGAGKDGHLGLLHCLAGFFLFTHEARDFRRRSDELDIRGATDFSEVRVLAHEAVAGMNRIDVRDFRSRDNRRHIEIAVGQARRADADGLVGETHVERVAVSLAVDGNRANAEFLAGIEDAQCDFATVGDENLTKHS